MSFHIYLNISLHLFPKARVFYIKQRTQYLFIESCLVLGMKGRVHHNARLHRLDHARTLVADLGVHENVLARQVARLIHLLKRNTYFIRYVFGDTRRALLT